MELEQFKDFPIEEYKSRYKVSSRGRIWSNRKQAYLKTLMSNGYTNISINVNNSQTAKQLRVDIIIATTFLGNSDLYLEHLDGDNTNNNLSNLRWIEFSDYLNNKYESTWKPVGGYEKYYISTKGHVWSSYSEDMIKQQIVSGYKSVNIGYPKQLFKHIHRLVAMTFIDNKHNYPVVNHKDGNKMNNSVDNLEWMTYSQNCNHALDNFKRKPYVKGENCEHPSFSIELDWLLGYLIVEDGNVYSQIRNRYLKLQKNDNGYYRIHCKVGNKYRLLYVHRLVGEAYLDKPLPKQTQVNHKNMDRLDNRFENLEWVTPSENNQHSVDNNPKQYKHLQKKVARLDKDSGEIIDTFNGLKEASRITKINSGSICKVCKGVHLTAGGYKWKYIDQ